MKLLTRVCVALLLAVTITFGGFYSNANALPVNHDGIDQIFKGDNKNISTDDSSYTQQSRAAIQESLQADNEDKGKQPKT